MGIDEEASAAVVEGEKPPLHILREGKSTAEEIIAKLLSIKMEGRPKSEISELLTEMFLNFVTLRQANREILLEEDRVKEETERAKAPAEFTMLQLHNLMYEKSHYVKAINACKDFKSKYTELEIVTDEEFLRGAPEEIKASTLSIDVPHDLMLKRLNYELYQRKELCKIKARLEQKKKGLVETIAKRKKFMSSLPSHFKLLKKAFLPVQNQLGFQNDKKLNHHHLAELLPPPLYVIYSQFLAQKEAFEERIELEIVGSLKDAQNLASQQAVQDSGILNNEARSEKEHEATDEDDDGQKRRKRPKKVSSKEGLVQAALDQVHPLKIIVHVFDDGSPDLKTEKLVTLRFDSWLKLNIVSVGIEGCQEGPEANILCNLFPDDAGLEPPHQSAKLILDDYQSLNVNRTSRPYKWAQILAGIDFLPEVSPFLTKQVNPRSDMSEVGAVTSDLQLGRLQNLVQTVLQRIRSRRKAQMDLH